MGGGQSRLAGGSGSRRRGDDDDDDAGPCCFFLGDAARNVSRHIAKIDDGGGGGGDALGTPMPETPLFQRKRRGDVREALRREEEQQKTQQQRQVFSSKYGGLEKEVSGMWNSSKSNTRSFAEDENGGTTADEGGGAVIYEGPDCEGVMHARYELCEVLGVGSTSTVYRCVNRRTNESFACKVIDCQLMEERFEGMMAQFQTEIEALRQLKHPGIIRLYDVYIKPDDKIYIVMEMMEGGELFDYVVQKGTLTEEEASQIVRKVTSAMVFMHSQNIVHRDLKPENLLLKKKPKGPNDPIDVKIIDFGLSKAMIEPVARTFLGTRGYLAPEMLQRRDYDRSVDTWALGVIVFVLLCGCLPFDDDSATVPSDDVVRAKFVLRFPRWAKNLSASAKNLLENLLNVDPAQRYTAEEALQHPWVQGSTAPRANLLASPNRIRKSPNLRKSPLPPTTTTTAAAAAGNINVRKKQQPRGAAVCTTPDDSPKVAPIRQASL